MDIKEIKSLLEKKFSPKMYKIRNEVYGFHYGLKYKAKNFKKVMLTIDLSLESIHFALKNKINLIISNYGLIDKPIKNFNPTIINKLSLLSRYPISIFVLNSSLIAAEGGTSDTIMDLLYLKLDKLFYIKNKNGIKIPIGRICLPKAYLNEEKSMKLEDLLTRIKNNFHVKRVSYVGDPNKIIKRICIVGGENFYMSYLKKAINCNCDCYISGNISHLIAKYARDLGLALIDLSTYETNILTLKKLSNLLTLEFPYDEFIVYESQNPLKYYN